MSTTPRSASVVNEGLFSAMVAGYTSVAGYTIGRAEDERNYVEYYSRWLLARERGPWYAERFAQSEIPGPLPPMSTARRLRIEADLAMLLALAAREG